MRCKFSKQLLKLMYNLVILFGTVIILIYIMQSYLV